MDTSRLSSFRQRLGGGGRPKLSEDCVIGGFEAYQVVRDERRRVDIRLHFSFSLYLIPGYRVSMYMDRFKRMFIWLADAVGIDKRALG